MDESWKWAFMAAPTLVTALAVVAGFRAWYWQLIAKRRFEVAEQVLIAFRRSTDAISAIRAPAFRGDEEQLVQLPAGLSPDQTTYYRRYGVYFNRAERHLDAFKEIRLAQLLCATYLTNEAAVAMSTPTLVRDLVLFAAEMMIVDHPTATQNPGDPEYAELWERQSRHQRDLIERRDEAGTPQEGDRLSAKIDEAKSKIEAACVPLLRPQTFRTFIFGSMRPDR
jgi:hypothetical protein